MFLIAILGLLAGTSEGAVVWRRQAGSFPGSEFGTQFGNQFGQQITQFGNQFNGSQPFPGSEFGTQFGQQVGQYGSQFNASQPFPGPEFGQQVGQQWGGQAGSQFGQQVGQFGSQFGNQQVSQFGQQPIPFVPSQFQGQQPQPNQQRTEVKPEATPIPILKFQVVPNLGDGKYQYSYETGNGIKQEESGSQKSVGEPAQLGTVATGSYSYTDPEGNLIQVSYTADENGFVPRGDHLPKAPPIPAEILAALEKNAAEEAAENAGQISPAYHHFFRSAYPDYQNTRRQRYLRSH